MKKLLFVDIEEEIRFKQGLLRTDYNDPIYHNKSILSSLTVEGAKSA